MVKLSILLHFYDFLTFRTWGGRVYWSILLIFFLLLFEFFDLAGGFKWSFLLNFVNHLNFRPEKRVKMVNVIEFLQVFDFLTRGGGSK